MGSATRPKPVRLAEKLSAIRAALGLSQSEMLRRLELSEELFRSSISAYERGTREPPYPVLLKYAQAAGVCTDILIDDNLNLPARIPSSPQHRSHDRKVIKR
jgi:transcriptional regulator with XRE-family HTH domain